MSRRTHETLQVVTQQGRVGHPGCAFSTRPDGTLRIFDSAGIERKVYAAGYWSQVLLGESAPVDRSTAQPPPSPPTAESF